MTQQADRMPPHDRNAESSLLGCILRDNAQFDESALVLRDDDFYVYANRLAFAAMLELRQAGKPLDVHLLAVRLKEQGELDDVTPAYLLDLWDSAPASGDALEYAAIIRNHACARALITACNEIIREAYEPGDSAGLLENAERRIFAIAQRDVRGDVVSHSKVIDEAMEVTDKRVNLFRRGEMTGAVPYGLIDLDTATAGMHAGELIIIGARPGVGKTIFGCHLADVASGEGLPALFISLEQARHELALRLLSKHARVNAFKLRGGSITNAERLLIGDAAEKTRHVPLWWDDAPCQSVSRISAQARRVKAKHGLALLVVDYMQLIDAPNKRQKRHEAVGEMSRGLKLLARDLKIPVVAMAQLNRDVENRGGEPRLSDLREAGGIEQDADTVILMHRAMGGDESVSQVKLLIRKQRNGPLSDVIVMHEAEHYALVNGPRNW